jgi:L-fuconolactonase
MSDRVPDPLLDPHRPIIDAHHHLYDRPRLRYMFDDYLADITCGHNLRASVFVQARTMLRTNAPESLQSVGEVEFANGMAAMSASGIYGPARICAGIVGYADLTLGTSVRGVLERLIMAGGGLVTEGGRLCGIRQPLCWDSDSTLLNSAYPTTSDMMENRRFREGFAQLAPIGLSFDVWAFFHQLPMVAELARAFPDTSVILNHFGGVVRTGRHADDRGLFERWRKDISALAACPNVSIKLSGLGMPIFGFTTDTRTDDVPASQRLANMWAPWVETCLNAFGANRCMYASNFPVDKTSYAFSVGINALKRLTAAASETEKDEIFLRTAQQVYRLPL